MFENQNQKDGWKMFLDLVSNHYKYERVENYVSARQVYQEDKQAKRDKLMKK